MADLPYDPANKYDHPDPPAPGGTQDTDLWTRYPRMAAQAIAQGAGETIGRAGDVLQKFAAPYAKSIDPAIFPGLSLLTGGVVPTSPEVDKALTSTGIQAPDITPQDPYERIGSAVLKGAGASGPLAGFGPGVILSGALGGGAEQTAREVFRDQPDVLKYAAPIAGVVGGSLAGAGPEAVTDVRSLVSDLASGDWQRILPRLAMAETAHLASQAFDNHIHAVSTLAGAFFPAVAHAVRNIFTHPQDTLGGLFGSYANAPPPSTTTSLPYNPANRYDYPEAR